MAESPLLFPEVLIPEFNQLRIAIPGVFCVLQEADDIINGHRPGNTEVAKNEFALMSVVAAKSFMRYQDWGLLNDFFGINGLAIIETPLVEPSILFRAIGKGWDEAIKETLSVPETEYSQLRIATVGKKGVGKGLITSHLREKHNFLAYPLSDRVRELAAAYGNMAPFGREILIKTGIDVKDKFGAGVLIRAAIRMFSEPGREQRLLFDGLRTEAEAEDFLRLAEGQANTILIAVTTGETGEADQKIRFRRSLGRGGPKDPTEDTQKAFEIFCESDNKEGIGIDKAISLATHTIVNRDGEKEQTIEELEKIIDEIELK